MSGRKDSDDIINELKARLGLDRGRRFTKAKAKEEPMSDMSGADREAQEILGQVNEVNEAVGALLEIAQSLHGKFPIQDIADELRHIIGKEFSPIGTLIADGLEHLQRRGAMFRARLITEIVATHHLSEGTALALVVNEQQQISKAVRNIELNKSSKKQD